MFGVVEIQLDEICERMQQIHTILSSTTECWELKKKTLSELAGSLGTSVIPVGMG